MNDPVLVNGLWCPAGDLQLINGLQNDVKPRKRPIVDGRVAWRYDRISAVLEFLPPERRRVAIDVGAHIGMWTRWLARDFKVTYAFEPIPHFYDLLNSNLIPEYENVYTFREGLGDTEHNMWMVVETEISGRSHIHSDEDAKGAPSEIVYLRPLDSWGFSRVDFIKIDVEGWESKVLVGAEETIRRDKPVIVVEQLGHEVRYGDKKNAALDILKSWGMVKLRPNMKGDYYMGWA